MTELTFTKTFLSSLDARPIKLQADHITNPKTLELHFPYTLPRMPNAMKKSSATSSSTSDPANSSTDIPGQAPTITVTLKSSRNPPLDMKVADIDAGATSILDLKERVAGEIGMEGKTEKVKILWAKKPVSDAKTVKEAVGDDPGLGEGKVEFAVMVMGYTAPTPAPAKEVVGEEMGAKVGGAEKMDVDEMGGKEVYSADEALGGEAFWADLKGFLQQRLKDEGLAGDALKSFQDAWRRR